MLVNNSVSDPRRLVTVQLPVRLGASLADARKLTTEAASRVEHAEELTLDVQVGAINEKTAWLNVVAYAPPGSNVPQIASEIRERALAALAEAELLPAD
jgi:small-conductance mechanosensitive channel